MPLGFIQATIENSESVKGLLKILVNRNFRFEEGLLTITDGAKGLKKSVEATFGKFMLHQRCQWHKRENIISYLYEEEKPITRGKLQQSYDEPDYEAENRKLIEIREELNEINRSAPNSLEEGI